MNQAQKKPKASWEDSPVLGAEDIFSFKSKYEIKHVKIPQWDRFVCIRTPTAMEKGRFEASVVGEGRDVKTLKIRLCIMMLCDGYGKRLFTVDDIEKVGELNAGVIDLIANECLAMMQISPDDLEAATKN